MSKIKSINAANRQFQDISHLRLKKVTAMMLATAVLSAASLQAGAQALTSNRSGNIDGGMQTGYLITGDERFNPNGPSSIQIGTTGSQSLVHSFKTVGGAGSGGGAGLGGAFFVDDGASLTVINTNFANNRVQGGSGGSVAPVSYAGQMLNILGANVDLDQVPVPKADLVSGRYERFESGNGTVTYEIGAVTVSRDVASMILRNAPAVFTDYGNVATKIENVNTAGLVTFTDEVTATAIKFNNYVAPTVTNSVTYTKTTNQVDEQVTVTVQTGGTSGFFVNSGGTINIDYGFTYDTMQVDTGRVNPQYGQPISATIPTRKVIDIPGANDVNKGDKVFVGLSNDPTAMVANIVDVIRYTAEDDLAANANNTLVGKPKAIVLDVALPTTSGSSAVTSIEVIKEPTFNLVPFAVNSSDRKKIDTFKQQATYVPGMSVSWEIEGTTSTAKVVSVSADGKQVTLDKDVPAAATSLKFIENPLTGDNSVRVTGASSKFKQDQIVYVPGLGQDTFVGTVTSVVGDVVTVTPQNAGQNLADFYDPNLGLSLKISAADVSNGNRSITVPFNTSAYAPSDRDQKIKDLLKDRTVVGASFDEETTVQSVTVGDGQITILLSKPATSNVIEGFSLASPLVMGGNMNGLTDTFDRVPANNGTSGWSATDGSSFFNNAEGVDGTNGRSAKDNTDGRGYNGGAGGNGSNGLPVDFFLVYDQTVATIQLKQAYRNLFVAQTELVNAAEDLSAKSKAAIAAATPDPQGGLAFTGPDPVEILAASEEVQGAVKELTLKAKNNYNAKFDMAWAISDLVLATTNLTKWAIELDMGLAGLGGAGGDGGQGSGGADFFGGGAGGAGGNGGNGAKAISDGGDGGSGGQGGAGGFGAGGGQGGAGGLGGQNGNAGGGDPGDGGWAGFGAGEGANGDGNFGGGGAGLGGSIFVRTGGSLLIQGNSRFSNNYVAGGSTSSQFGEAGSEAGTDLFMMKDANVRLQPGEGKTIQFDGTIADDSFATNDGFQHAAGFGSDLRIGGTGGNGGGLVVLNGENTYSGNTILEGATLSAEVGTGVNDLSLIRFNGSGSTAANFADNKVTSTLSLDSVGTFLLGDDYTRLAGMDPSETAWTGSGGFASGIKGLVTVNLGAQDDEGAGQDLKWGADGFFVTPSDGNGVANNGVLTFGSDYSEGWMEFTNNVNLDNKTARVAVYKNAGDYRSSNATLSGNWVNTNDDDSVLMVGDSSGTNYNGTLFMTGQNSLDNLVVAGGTLSTYDQDGENGAAGKLFKSTANLVVLADKDNAGEKTHLQLFSEEALANVSVLLGGNLTLNQKLTVSGNFDNKGTLRIYGDQFGALDESVKTARIAAAGMADYLPEDFDAWNGALVVNGNFVNSGTIDQLGQITAANISSTAGSNWSSTGNLTATVDFVNTGNLVTVGNIHAGRDVINHVTGILVETGDLSSGRDFSNAGDAQITGKITVGNDLLNSATGEIVSSDALSVGTDLSNHGSLAANSVTVSNGLLTNTGTVTITTSLDVDAGSVNNLGTMTVGNAASIHVDLNNAATKLFDVLSGGLQVGGSVSNDGSLKAVGNTTVGVDLTNSSTGNLRIDTGSLGIDGSLNNAGIARVDGATTVGANLVNSNTLSILQGGLDVGTELNNRGLVTVNGDTSVGADLINHNTSTSDLAVLTVTEGALSVVGGFDNRGVATVAGATTIGAALTNSTLATLTVQQGGLDVGSTFVNHGDTDVTGGVTVANDVTNTALLTVQDGGLSVEGAFVNSGTSTVTGNSLVRFNLTNSGDATFNNDLQVVGSFSNNEAISTVNGNARIEFDLTNTSSAATFEGNLSVGRRLNNLGTDSVLRLNGDLISGSDLTNQGTLLVVGNAAVLGDVNNTGFVSLTGDLTTPNSKKVTNDGYWRVGQDSTIKTGVLQGAANAVFCLSGADSNTCSGDATTATELTLDLSSSSSSVFAGVFAGTGSLVKTGTADLLLTQDQTFSGGLTVNGGRLVMDAKLHDDLNIEVGPLGTYVVGRDDIVRFVRNNAPQSVILDANLTTTAGFENNGRLAVNPTVIVEYNSTRLERTLNTGNSGFSGSSAGNVEVAQGTTFRLDQNGDSTYAGKFTRMGEDAALVKEGTGKLTLSNTVDLEYVTISEGELALAAGNILSSDAVVSIADEAALTLLAGNQSIHQLLGNGDLNLGANTLSIETGGSFFGRISGTGQLAVRSGPFTISQELTTPDASFDVNTGSTTSLLNGASLKVKQLDVHGVMALGASGGAGATVEANDGFNVYGTLKGGGSINKGVTTIHTGANLMPGYSPGTLTFSEGLHLDTGSVTTMEIKDPALAAGVGFDQLIVGTGAEFKITHGAILDIQDDGLSGPLALGSTVKLFNFSVGKVQGQFGQVNAEAGMGVGALNLATGNVVGLGASNMTQIRNSAKTANEKAIYSGLLQTATGNVSQFYGGRFIENLILSSASGAAATKAVYNAYNPEAYLSLSDVSQAATQEAFPTWKSSYLNKEKLVAFAGNSIKSTSQGDDHQVYGLGIKSLTVGATRSVGQNTLIFTMGGINSTVSSKSVQSSGSGFTAGIALFGAVPSLTDTTWFTGIAHSSVDQNGRRTNLNGGTTFNGVGSDSSKLELGIEKRIQMSNTYWMLRGSLALGTTNRDRVNENGNVDSLDTMSVHASRYGFKMMDLGLEFGNQINSKTQWYGAVNYQVGDLNKNTVKVGFDNDQAQFNVEAKSAMSANGKLSTGLRHQYSNDLSIDASIGLARSWDRQSNVLGRIELSKSF